MRCPTCGVYGALEDNFCRRCGTAWRNSRLPVRRLPAQLPAVWQPAVPALMRGAALIAAGVAAEWLLRLATRRALAIPLGRSHRSSEDRALAKSDARPALRGDVAVSETVVMRRVVVRR